MTLYGGLEEKLNMGIKEDVDNHISMKNGEKPQSTSRRSFLQKLFGLGAGAVIGSSGMTISNEANAKSNEVPPGIEEAAKRDPAIKTAYQYWHYPQWLNSYNSSSKDIVQYILNGYNPTGKVVHIKINPETPYLEPAYWFMHTQFKLPSNSNGVSTQKVGKKNLPLAYFADSMYTYFTAWVEGHRNREYHQEVFIQKTEDYLLKSIFTAAGESEDKVGIYKGYSLELKERYLQTKIMKNLETKSHNNQLVAAWASTWLTNHYFLNGEYNKGQNGDIMNNFEINIRKSTGIEIRGPPYYYKSTGNFKV